MGERRSLQVKINRETGGDMSIEAWGAGGAVFTLRDGTGLILKFHVTEKEKEQIANLLPYI